MGYSLLLNPFYVILPIRRKRQSKCCLIYITLNIRSFIKPDFTLTLPGTVSLPLNLFQYFSIGINKTNYGILACISRICACAEN